MSIATHSKVWASGTNSVLTSQSWLALVGKRGPLLGCWRVCLVLTEDALFGGSQWKALLNACGRMASKQTNETLHASFMESDSTLLLQLSCPSRQAYLFVLQLMCNKKKCYS
eukprot:378579-Pelagomonas_calceolata.AAC.5